MTFGEWLQYVVSLFVICSPLTAIPVLIALTPGVTPSERKFIGLKVGITCGLILILSTWFGGSFLSFLQVKVASFQVTGGLIILLLGLSMLSSESVKEGKSVSKKGSSVIVVPLAMPLLAGPGAISTAIIEVSFHSTFLDKIYLSLAGATLGLIIGVILYASSRIEKIFGIEGLNIVTKIGGLILAALAIESMSNGIAGLMSCYHL
jgi:multiple antibiotic resistance protein